MPLTCISIIQMEGKILFNVLISIKLLIPSIWIFTQPDQCFLISCLFLVLPQLNGSHVHLSIRLQCASTHQGHLLGEPHALLICMTGNYSGMGFCLSAGSPDSICLCLSLFLSSPIWLAHSNIKCTTIAVALRSFGSTASSSLNKISCNKHVEVKLTYSKSQKKLYVKKNVLLVLLQKKNCGRQNHWYDI